MSLDCESGIVDFEQRALVVDSKHLCGSLVEVKSGIVNLVHTSAKQ